MPKKNNIQHRQHRQHVPTKQHSLHDHTALKNDIKKSNFCASKSTCYIFCTKYYSQSFKRHIFPTTQEFVNIRHVFNFRSTCHNAEQDCCMKCVE